MGGKKRNAIIDEKKPVEVKQDVISYSDFDNLTLLQLDKLKIRIERRIFDLLDRPPDVNTILYDIEKKNIAIYLQRADISSDKSIMRISGVIEYEFKRVDGYIDMKTVKPVPISSQRRWVGLLNLKVEDLPLPKDSQRMWSSNSVIGNNGSCSAHIYFKRRFKITPGIKFEYLDFNSGVRKGIFKENRTDPNVEADTGADLFIVGETVYPDIYFLGYSR
jgi:hypothetical protein